MIKDPYNFDFLTLTEGYREKELEASSVPIGISEYQLSKVLPKEIESSLPSIEEIKKSLKDIAGE